MLMVLNAELLLMAVLALAALVYLVNTWETTWQVLVVGASVLGGAFIALVAIGFIALDPNSPNLVYWRSMYQVEQLYKHRPGSRVLNYETKFTDRLPRE